MIGIVGIDSQGWRAKQLTASLKRRGVAVLHFSFSELVGSVNDEKTTVNVNDINLIDDLPGVIVHSVGRGSLEEIILRMDLLHTLRRRGVYVINPPGAIEKCVDKYYALALLRENGLPVPQTVVTENVEEALRGFEKLGGDVVLKPLFGSRGVGSTRITNRDIAERIFKSVRFHHGVLYLQKFVPHGISDLRTFVIGDQVIAAMKRIGDSWKTNVSQGARPEALQIDEKLEAITIKAASAVDCEFAGVDILEDPEGPLIVELNSQPGWRGLQSVTERNIADCIIDHLLSEVKR